MGSGGGAPGSRSTTDRLDPVDEATWARSPRRVAGIAAGLTQAELAHKIGSAAATLSRIERGKLAPSQAMLENIAAGLRCSVRDFYEPSPSPPEVKVRSSQAKLLVVTEDMTDAEIDDVVRAVKTLVKVGRRMGARGG